MDDARAALGRRTILGAGLAAVGGMVLAGCSAPAPRPVATTPSPVPPITVLPTPSPSATVATRVRLTKRLLPSGTIGTLPVGTPGIAWTVDDGADSAVVEAYARFAAATGIRLTFFLNGYRPSWTEHADLLRPMVRTGQVQLGNHTWSHPALTQLSDSAIEEELLRNHDFIASTYGVDARPYYRPPYGYHDARVDAAAARVGYSTPVLWYGSLADSGPLTTKQVIAQGRKWFLPAHLVIGHANHPGTIGALPSLQRILQERRLGTYTLHDVFRSSHDHLGIVVR